MPSTFFGLTIASSGLSAFQTSINTVANNISNVQTEGYSRQTANLEATSALRVYSKYGSVGTGVAVTSITQERNEYYDTKYWENNASLGYYDQKLYYLDQIETYFTDDSTLTGFSTIFSEMFNALDTLKTNSADESVRNQFINEAQSLCTYFNSLSQSLSEIQEDCNKEIKSTVDTINSISEQISLLNQEIYTIEVRGGTANDLRDQRAVLIDELSLLVDVEVQEYEVQNTNGENLGATNYRVFINGQTLVDGDEYRTLECVASEYKQNQTDVDGLYSIIWTDTGMDFSATSANAGGSLKALFEVRDGSNADNLTGTVSSVDGNSVTITDPSITSVNALNIASSGQITIGNKVYTYDSWSAEVGEDGITSFTFNLTEEASSSMEGKSVSCGSSVDAMGVVYYQAQINEFLRTFAEMFNTIERSGVDLNGDEMGSFFVGETKTGVTYDLDEYYEALNEDGAYTLTSDMDSYYLITAANIKVNDKSMKDPTYFSTTVDITNGTDAYDLAEELLTLQSGVTMFRGDTAEAFLETLLSDISVDVNKNTIFYSNYSNLEATISNQRTSVSGVDEDEEALDLVKFQNAYNLASKMVSVMAELYDKLINETGVT